MAPLKYLTAGESHGPALTALIEGLPAGMSLSPEKINFQLSRRQKGYGRGGRMAIENDQVKILSGLRGCKTIGSPLTLLIFNRDWENWQEEMDPVQAPEGKRRVTRPRPGHADLAGAEKYRRFDLRDVLERASARETAARVAAGAVARQLLLPFNCRIYSHLISLGGVKPKLKKNLGEQDFLNIDDSLFRCLDPKAEDEMKAAVDTARMKGDTLGGIIEVIVFGLPPGLGSYVSADRRLDGRLAGAVMSIPAIKGVEIGLGFEAANYPGSLVHDPIQFKDGKVTRSQNGAGGLEGGITNGEPLVIRAAMKPIPTLMKPLPSIDLTSGKEDMGEIERSDVCAVSAAAVVAEAAVIWELAAAWMEKFGGDSWEELNARVELDIRQRRQWMINWRQKI